MDEVTNNGVVLEKYKLNIISSTDTEISVFIPGGTSGKYKIKVVKDEITKNIPGNDDFTYEIVHSTTFPKVSSLKGGNILTIKGSNFSKENTDN